jgi:hypothetical protein
MLSKASMRRGQGLIDYGLCGRSLRKINIDDERFRARGLHRFRRALEVRAVPRDQNERSEIARKANGRRPADPLARAGDDRD